MFDSNNCPQRFKDSIDRYVAKRCPTGGFLRAVLENNLKEAISRADPEACEHLGDIVNYVYNQIPMSVWGSPEKVKRHLSGLPKGNWIKVETDSSYKEWVFEEESRGG